ncbi:tetratricopeptide repeat protein [Faecalibacter bovis]|uniref:Tetratricopeptide repeat protein n=1 Tax=Faecalibacter bovis TaxID=2898187 RepID=A0ABX7XBH3_9FLAO|nr:tetratricopeptide repeat protein [Faecalibacter bovis]QTV05251.1 tetratricopeptide repeat protein [Faecalibacter bovis]
MQFIKQSLFITSLFAVTNSFACINGPNRVLSTGTTLYIDHEGHVPYGHEFWLNDPQTELRKLDSLYQVEPSPDFLNQKGIVYIIAKDYQKAIDLYLKIEKENPNQYSTASNLGTAYELIGDNKNALKWIERALELNPNSHEKSEWIHVNILKYKLGQFDLTSKNLINTDFGTEDFPKTNLSKQDLEQLLTQMYFQLNERRSFVAPKDEIVAQLLFDYGNGLLLNDKYAEAKEVYEHAIKYGFESPLIHKRIELASVEKSPETSFQALISNYWDTILISVISTFGFVFVLNKKNKKNRNKKSL